MSVETRTYSQTPDECASDQYGHVYEDGACIGCGSDQPAPEVPVTENTGAEKRARSIASLFEGLEGWKVEIKSETTDPIYFKTSGGILSHGRISWTVWATGPWGESLYASWTTFTTGRKTTRFGYGNRSYGYGDVKGRKLTAESVGFYARMAAGL